MNCKCGTPVVEGQNGTVYEAPPWMPEGSSGGAICYACENNAEQDAEDERQECQIDAAIRAGRMDLI